MAEIQSLIEIIKSCETTIFTTFSLEKYPESRTILNKINDNITDLKTLHFFTKKTSHKVEQINKNNNCSLYYFNSTTRKAIRIFGIVRVTNDKKYWQDEFTKFGYTNKDDETLCFLEFTPQKYKFYVGDKEYTGEI